MPNHITTVATITGDAAKVDAFRVAHIITNTDGDGFDFRTVIPQPACVVGTSASNVAEEGFFALTGMSKTSFATFADGGARYFANRAREGFEVTGLTTPDHLHDWLAEHHPDVLEEGRKMLACFRETGHTSWYDWNIANWGTKWGAYSYKERAREPGRFVFAFDTAWSPPRPILAKLAEMWPELRIETKSIDEGGGAWSGVGGAVESVEETRDLHIEVYGDAGRFDPDPEEAAE